MLKLYSTNCPRCNVLEKKLNQSNIKFKKINDFNPDELLEKGFTTAPILYDEDKNTYMQFKEAIEYINSL